MKFLILFAICLVVGTIVSMPSCKKDKDSAAGRVISKNRPIARAGDDFLIHLASCSDRTSSELDGSASSDPDGDISSYNWSRIYGPPGVLFRNSDAAKASIENISPGEYGFELSVKDVTGLEARDTVVLNVIGEPKEYIIDITFNSSYSYKDSAANCTGWYYYYNYSCDDHYRSTTILGKGSFSPVGEFTGAVSEEEISKDAGYFRRTVIHIFLDNINSVFVSGNCTVNFGSVIAQGGGPFNGTLQINNGSALGCDPNVYENLPPLTVSGNIDVATQNAVIRVQGKVYF